jgi:hypothetical protein
VPVVQVTGVAPITPRLLDVAGTAAYLGGIAEDSRVRLPGAGDRDMRRCLYDVRDLDALIEAWKDDGR